VRDIKNRTQTIKKIDISKAELFKALSSSKLLWASFSKISKRKYCCIGVKETRRI